MTTDMTPESLTLTQVRESFVYAQLAARRLPTYRLGSSYTAAFTDWLAAHDAEVARKTAERAWSECSIAWANRQIVAEAIISRAAECVREAYLRDQVAAVLSNTLPERPVNPYRAEQIGEEG